MILSPHDRPELDDRDEAAEIRDFLVHVLPFLRQSGKIKQLRALIQFGPESVLQLVLDFLLLVADRHQVEMRQDAHDARHSVNLRHVQKLENFHFESETRVDHQKHQIGHFGDVDHRIQVVGTLDEGDSSVLSGNDCDRPVDSVHLLLRVVFHERAHERRLSDFGWSDDGDDDRRRLVRFAFHDWNESLVALSILRQPESLVHVHRRLNSESLNYLKLNFQSLVAICTFGFLR